MYSIVTLSKTMSLTTSITLILLVPIIGSIRVPTSWEEPGSEEFLKAVQARDHFSHDSGVRRNYNPGENNNRIQEGGYSNDWRPVVPQNGFNHHSSPFRVDYNNPGQNWGKPSHPRGKPHRRNHRVRPKPHHRKPKVEDNPNLPPITNGGTFLPSKFGRSENVQKPQEEDEEADEEETEEAPENEEDETEEATSEDDEESEDEEETNQIDHPTQKIVEKHITHDYSTPYQLPDDIPTQPIYPGEGQWAVKGVKHQPYQKPEEEEEEAESEEQEEEETKPDGHEIFEQNQKLFNKQSNRFLNSFAANQPQAEREEQEEEEDGEEEAQGFVPIQIYSQVRRSENEEHLPESEAPEERLREVVRDSKIQTVYTEEGYEDSGYDHAGHEKQAEQDEGFAEFDKEVDKSKADDSESAGTHHQPPVKVGNFIKTEEVKTTAVKDRPNGDSEMEISSQIKIVAAPNSTKTHKYVKVFPKVYRYDSVTTQPPETTTTAVKPNQTQVAQPSRTVSRFWPKRVKRFVNDLPKISAQTDFIDKIDHRLPIVRKKFEKPKYPYYNDPNINPDSPLRYSEDLANIPQKHGDDLAFYQQAESKVPCEEVEDSVDPIPDRVKNAGEESGEHGEAPEPKLPRLKNLGGKIECFKRRYFGDNPLDSPFFAEGTVAPVAPIFKGFSIKLDTASNEIRKDEDFKKIPRQDVKTTASSDVASVSTATTTLPPTTIKATVIEGKTTEASISIITTPKYTINLKPKHIYDQIELLRYLPKFNATNTTQSSSEVKEFKNTIELSKSSTSDNRESRNLVESTLPESQSLKKRRRRVRPKRPQIFDINRFLPQNPYMVLDRTTKSTTPKHSEVDYKNEINQDEQLNVFADVINNIKNSTKDLQASSTSNNYGAHKDSGLMQVLEKIEETNSFYQSTTRRPFASRGNVKFTSYLNKLQELELDKSTTEAIFPTTVKYDPYLIVHPTPEYNQEPSLLTPVVGLSDSEGLGSEVLGLIPPKPVNVRPKKKRFPEMELFHVPGMKPPPLKQNLLYPDFKVRPMRYHAHRRRVVRSANRQYSPLVRNRNRPIDVEDDATIVEVPEEDDYVPHRHRNYHYDEKTKRIVYDTTTKNQPEVEEEYIEVTDAPIPVPSTRKSTFKLVDNHTGPSFVDYIKKVKAHPDYQEIPDPTTTEKSAEVTSTTKAASTTPPQFLNILSKVKSDSKYHEIKDKNATKSTTTAVPPVEIEVEESRDEVKERPNFQIFDINDYLPKIPTPRSTIDYAKYKTIERPHVRQSVEKESSTQTDLEASRPIPIRTRTTESTIEMSASQHEETQADSTTSTRPIPIRTRTRVPTNYNSDSSTTRPIPIRTRSRGTRPTTSTPEVVPEAKPHRTHPRRRPVRIRTKPEDQTEKRIEKRHQNEEDAPKESEKSSPVKNQADVQVFKPYDKTQKHGGNYRREDETDGDENESKKVDRLTDVVPKPVAFYSDPKLPNTINQLKEVGVKDEEAEKVSAGETEDDQDDSEEVSDYDSTENDSGKTSDSSTTTTTTLKPAVIVKDPNRRLYYYAKV